MKAIALSSLRMRECTRSTMNSHRAEGKLGQTDRHREDEELARKNFRVAVITPEEVEQVDLSNPAEARRWVWTLSKESGGPGEVKSANADGEGISRRVGEWRLVETW